MKQVEVAVIGCGWCGGIRAETLEKSALVGKPHIREIKPERLTEVRLLTNPAAATLDYHDIVANPDISVVYISTTPEGSHYPIARDCLKAGKHVRLEKPVALELPEADDLITISRAKDVKFMIGYLQWFNSKIAYAKSLSLRASLVRWSTLWSAGIHRATWVRRSPTGSSFRQRPWNLLMTSIS